MPPRLSPSSVAGHIVPARIGRRGSAKRIYRLGGIVFGVRAVQFGVSLTAFDKPGDNTNAAFGRIAMNDMTDAFFKKKNPLRPFLYLSPSAQNISLISLCLLSLQVLMLALTKSWGSLIVIGASLSGFIGADLLHAKLVSSSRFSLVSAIFQGTVTGMLIPSTFHPVTVFCIAFSTMFLIKYLSIK